MSRLFSHFYGHIQRQFEPKSNFSCYYQSSQLAWIMKISDRTNMTLSAFLAYIRAIMSLHAYDDRLKCSLCYNNKKLKVNQVFKAHSSQKADYWKIELIYKMPWKYSFIGINDG